MSDATIDMATFKALQESTDAEFVAELLGAYFEELPQMLAELRKAHASGTLEPFRRAAHSIKSNSNTFGALTLGAMARALELGEIPTDSAALDALEAEYARVVASLTELTHG
jgi:HPt (histidine-containing phosphotransfer) domain-containing protein